MIHYLVTDTAMELSRVIVGIFAPCLREEEQQVALSEVYEAVKAALLKYEERADRAHKRVNP